MTKREGRIVFPFYLKPGPNQRLLTWLGKQLKVARGTKSLASIANAAGVTVADIRPLEQGEFKLNLGSLRQIIHEGYQTSLLNLLSKCYDIHLDQFDSTRKRRFERTSHYSVSRDARGAKLPTPLLVGGDPDSYIWAIPMRRLAGQPMEIEFLELAPARKRKTSGITPDNAHGGAEVIQVLYGTVEAHIFTSGDDSSVLRLKSGDCIHFLASHPHHVENVEKNGSALLLIIRAQGIT